MVAGLLLVLVVVNSFATGYIMREVRSLRKVCARVAVEQRALNEDIAELEQDME